MNKQEEYIARLERRADHLAVRIANARIKGLGFSYDVTELNALLWAIQELNRMGHQLILSADTLAADRQGRP